MIVDIYEKLTNRKLKISKLVKLEEGESIYKIMDKIVEEGQWDANLFDAKYLLLEHSKIYKYDPSIDLHDPDYIFYVNKKVKIEPGKCLFFSGRDRGHHLIDIYYEDENLRHEEVTDVYTTTGTSFCIKLKKNHVNIPHFNVSGIACCIKNTSVNTVILDLDFYFVRDKLIKEAENNLPYICEDIKISDGQVILGRSEELIEFQNIFIVKYYDKNNPRIWDVGEDAPFYRPLCQE